MSCYMMTTHLGADDLDSMFGSRHKHRPENGKLHGQVDTLAATLQDTNKNLRTVDKMLGNYKEIGQKQSSAMERLKEDIRKTSAELEDEKVRLSQPRKYSRPRHTHSDGEVPTRKHSGRQYPSSPLREYDHAASDHEYEVHGSPSQRHRPFPKEAIRFRDDMDADESLHFVHQKIRDLSSGQFRLEQDINNEQERRNRFEFDSAKAMQNLAENVKANKYSSVDARLETIQRDLQNPVQLKQASSSEAYLSQPLIQSLQRQKYQQDVTSDVLHQRLSQTESQRNMIDDLSQQLAHMEEEKRALLQKMRIQEHRHVAEHTGCGQQSVEDELRELRSQVSRTASAMGEYAELKREAERMERQRQQLSDHLTVMQNELDTKERQSAKVINQLQSVTEKYHEIEEHYQQTQTQLRDAQGRLKDASARIDFLSGELNETRQELQQSEQKRQELKIRAQETVKQWKAKCKRLEEDVNIYNSNNKQVKGRNERVEVELEHFRTQSTAAVQQLEHIKREFSALLAVRAQLEEDVRLKDIQVNELKSYKIDMDKDLRDYKSAMEKMEHELQTGRERLVHLTGHKEELEMEVTQLRHNNMAAQHQFASFQKEIKELNLVKVDQDAQLAELNHELSRLRTSLKETQESEQAARLEREQVVRRVTEEKLLQSSQFDALKAELQKFQGQQSEKASTINWQMKKKQAEYEAEIQALRVDFDEQRSNAKMFKRQNEKLKVEVDRLNQDLTSAQEQVLETKRKYSKLKEAVKSKTQLTEDELDRAHALEDELLETKEAMRRVEKDLLNTLQSMAAEVDAVIEVATKDSVETYKALALTKHVSGEPHQLLAEVKSKLAWLKQELRESQHLSQNMKRGVRAAVEERDTSQRHLMEEIQKQSETLEQLAALRKRRDQAVVENSSVASDVALKVKDKRSQINERYAKLQDTVNSLKSELFSGRAWQVVPNEKNGLNLSLSQPTSPVSSPAPRRRRVRISSPPVRSPYRITSPSRSRKDNTPPINLQDDEFYQRFVPKSPPKFRFQDDSVLH